LEVCRRLQMPAVLTAGATDLWNWRLKDAAGPWELSDMDLLTSLTGTSTERTFHMVPCAMQAAAAKVVPKLFLADVLVRGSRDRQLAALLRELKDLLARFKEIFAQIHHGVDVSTFYDVYRPLLEGFFPAGILLQGESVVPEGVPFLSQTEPGADGGGALLNQSKGPSAGQSTILLIDAFLGVSHCKPGADFQAEMLTYMPALHRQMVLDYRERWADVEGVPQFVRRRQAAGGEEAPALVEAFHGCVLALRDLRRFHLSTVSRYLTRTNTGTGASAWRKLLQAMLDNTEAVCPFSMPSEKSN
ncbi:unnamed protein product, partial [Polarella glacialis]